MVQHRVKSGKEFEEYICKLYGFSRHIKNPRLKWSGKGRSNIKKLISPAIKDKLTAEASGLNLVKMKKKNKLPV